MSAYNEQGTDMAGLKTNAMRALESAGIEYTAHEYMPDDGAIDGASVANKIGRPPEQVFKTLVAQGASREYHVFVIPVAMELDLKAAAKAVGEKSVEMIRVADINKVTGYIRGGCSPIGMKKPYRTVIDSNCILQETIIVSAGRIGHQIELKPDDLAALTGAAIEDIAH
jgi:Cys-tRNA(Pro)/Cys-tRNA(Cys) deacylase